MESQFLDTLLGFIALAAIIYYFIRKKRRKNEVAKMNAAINAVKYVEDDELDEIEESYKQDELNYKRQRQRNLRHDRIKIVLRFMAANTELTDSKDFDSLQRNLMCYNNLRGQMRKSHIESIDIETAIRFCRMENFYGTCQHILNNQEIESLQQWRNININEEELLHIVMLSYKNDNENTLNSYVSNSARKNKLKSLINDLDKIMVRPLVKQYPTIIEEAKTLQSNYVEQLKNK